MTRTYVETSTASGTFEIEGFAVLPVVGCEIPTSDIAAAGDSVEELVRRRLLEFFAETFIVTGEPELIDVTLDGVPIADVLPDDDEEDEDIEWIKRSEL